MPLSSSLVSSKATTNIVDLHLMGCDIVIGQVVADVCMNCSAFIFNDTQVKNCFSLYIYV